jgi:hypothetical protein
MIRPKMRRELGLLLVLACGGSNEPAKNTTSSNDCPPGMTKEGGECVAPEGQGGPGKTPTTTTHTTNTGNTGSTGGTGGGTPTESGGKVPYDKETVEMVMKRAANQVKSACGSASDENGKQNGPWGTTKIQVTLGRNGHVHGVTVPDRYADKPVGVCVQHAFQNLIYAPYAAPADVTIDWEVEIVKP